MPYTLLDKELENVSRLRAALLAAAEQFARYADHHLAKDPPDREKAAANRAWSARCREAAGG